MVAGKLVDQTSRRTGLRALELRQQRDDSGKSFNFVINGVPVFAKGANWIPPTASDPVDQRQISRTARVCARHPHEHVTGLGGGIYESDDFYDLCDEMGILVCRISCRLQHVPG